MENGLNIPFDLNEQIARLKIRRDELNMEYQCNLKQIEFINKISKQLHPNDPERIALKEKHKAIVNRQMDLAIELAPVKVELKRLNTLGNEAKRIEAARVKDNNRKREYNRQFTARMRSIWEAKGKREALKRIERENKEALGEV